MVGEAANFLVRVFLEPECAACERVLAAPLSGPVCPDCWSRVPVARPPWCARCGDRVDDWRQVDPLCARCRRRPPAFSLARSAGRYDGSLRAILHAFKYGRRRTLAEPLGVLMREAGGDLLSGADAVVPVPLHPFRTIQRGFNQADDLARTLGLPVWRALRRTRFDPPQAALPAARRHGNVRGAFALARWPQRARLRNAAVVLVDDVMTTGATINACTQVLLESGVRRVGVLTAARAVTALPAPPTGQRHPSTVRRR
jgi:ComF family protein